MPNCQYGFSLMVFSYNIQNLLYHKIVNTLYLTFSDDITTLIVQSVHAHTYTHMHARIRTHTHTHIHTNTHTNTHTQTHTHTCTHMHMHVHIQIHRDYVNYFLL